MELNRTSKKRIAAIFLAGVSILAVGIILPTVFLHAKDPNSGDSFKDIAIKAKMPLSDFSNLPSLGDGLKKALDEEMSIFSFEKKNEVFSPTTSFLSKAPYVLASSDGTEAIRKLGLDEEGYREGISSLRSSMSKLDERGFIRNALLVSSGGVPIKKELANKFIDKENISLLVSDLKGCQVKSESLLKEESGTDVKLPSDVFLDPSINSFSYLGLQDLFPSAKEIKKHVFHGEKDENSYFIEDLIVSKYLKSDYGFEAVKYTIGKTDISFFLPNEGKLLKNLSISKMLEEWANNISEDKKIKISVPMFDIASSYKGRDFMPEEIYDFAKPFDLIAPEYASSSNWETKMRMENHFRFDNTGVYGSSISITSSNITSDPLDEGAIKFEANRPFCFLSSYAEIPLFLGVVFTPSA